VFFCILFGTIFAAGPLNINSMILCIRGGSKSIEKVIEEYAGKSGRVIFGIIVWMLTIVFSSVLLYTASSALSFDPSKVLINDGPKAASSLVLIVIFSLTFGLLFYIINTGGIIKTLLAIVLMCSAVYLGINNPVIKFQRENWQVILIIYVFIASFLPTWLYQKPRDFILSFLIYALVLCGLAGIIILKPDLQLSSIKSGTEAGGSMFPMLFIILSGGTISAFRSLSASYIYSKHIKREKTALTAGYGAVLIEGVIAVIALIIAGLVPRVQGEPLLVFTNGLTGFIKSTGITEDAGKSLVNLGIAALSVAGLDTSVRIGKHFMQDVLLIVTEEDFHITAIYSSAIITAVLPVFIAKEGYNVLWPLLGILNLAVAYLAYLTIFIWASRNRKMSGMIVIPFIFIFIISFSANIFLAVKSCKEGNIIQLAITVIVLVLALGFTRKIINLKAAETRPQSH
jgi:carbon starvation protein